MKKNSIRRLCMMAVIAALYTAVSMALAPIAFGNIQIRIAEALTLLPVLFADSIGAITLGCALTNLIGAMMGINILGFLDVFAGTLATFLAALCTRKLRKITLFKQPILSALMPVIFNELIIGAELSYALFPKEEFMLGWIICGFEVALGEALACLVLGLPLINYLSKSEITKRLGLQKL